MANLGSVTDLKDDSIDTNVTTNGQRQNTGARVNTTLNDIVDTLTGSPVVSTGVANANSVFASAAQGLLANSALQPEDVLPVALNGVLTGRTIWVDSVNGDDNTAVVGRQDLPFETIQEAIGAATSGYTVRIRPGAYTGPIVLKNEVNIECDAGVSITAAIDVINTYTVSDGGVAVTCSITGKPKLLLIEGDGPPAGACLHLSNASSVVYVDIEALIGDTTDTDMGIFLEGGRVAGSIGSITTTTYDGIWMASESCSVNLDIGSIVAGDNPIEVTACSKSELRIGSMAGNGVNIAATNESVDICITSQRCTMFGPSMIQTNGTGSIAASISLGQYDSGGGIGIDALCEGVVLYDTRIFNSTTPISLVGFGGYQTDGGAISGCILVGSGDSVTASVASTILSYGSVANTAVDGNVTVNGPFTVGAYVV